MFRIVLVAIAACFLAPILSGCAGNCGEKSVEVSWPIRVNNRPSRAAAPDYVMVPQYVAPALPAAPRYPVASPCN